MSVERHIEIALDPLRAVCPRCGLHYVDKSHVSFKRYGVCEVCYFKACKSALDEDIAAVEAERATRTAQKTRERAKRNAGMSTARVSRVTPKWD